MQLALNWWYWALRTSGTGRCGQVVLADLAKVDDIHWKMLTAARVETPEEDLHPELLQLLALHWPEAQISPPEALSPTLGEAD